MRSFLTSLARLWKYVTTYKKSSEKEFERRVEQQSKDIAARIPLTR